MRVHMVQQSWKEKVGAWGEQAIHAKKPFIVSS